MKFIVALILTLQSYGQIFAMNMKLNDNGTTFEVMRFDAALPSCVVLFSVGSGGNPERHLPLLSSLVESGCTVVAPYFDRIAGPRPTVEELLLRARRLRLALDAAVIPTLPVHGVGHSIGATMLLALAGGQMWMGPQQPISIAADERLNRLVLMAPPTGFFQPLNALAGVQVQSQVWAGTKDTVVQLTQADLLKQRLGNLVDLRIVEGAGHFSFMNTLPPQTDDSLPDRESFLKRLAVEICNFLGH